MNHGQNFEAARKINDFSLLSMEWNKAESIEKAPRSFDSFLINMIQEFSDRATIRADISQQAGRGQPLRGKGVSAKKLIYFCNCNQGQPKYVKKYCQLP